jgi:hypothetical protein
MKNKATTPAPRPFTPYTGSVALTQEQLRIRRLMLEEDCAISWDGEYATLADGFLHPKTFLALLRKGIIRYAPNTFQYVLVETNPGTTGTHGNESKRKRVALVERVKALKTELGLGEGEFAELLFEVAGQMRPEYLYIRDCKEVMERLGVEA